MPAPEEAKAEEALGFRVKSGWAQVVLLAGPAEAPRLLDCRRVELSDPAVPETRQPYHAGFGTHEVDQVKIDRRTGLIRRFAEKSVAGLLTPYRSRDNAIRLAGLIVGSLTDPAKLANPHIRGHAQEGRLFRTVLQEALHSHGVRSFAIIERLAYAEAAKTLRRSETDLKRRLTQLGAEHDSSWPGGPEARRPAGVAGAER